ncbi:MAG: signal peptidase II [Defluviitaleaceae bacterium]|nr:signal peptidase II [Defluviitaleaceae bacterium]MCL2275320.1 signal peptidase II [Defluviitaleaceae bacterium]
MPRKKKQKREKAIRNNVIHYDVKADSKPRGALPWFAFLFINVGLIAIDQWLKAWSSANLAGQGRRIVINGVIGMRYFHNTGAAFGFLGGFEWGRWVLIGIVTLLLIAVTWFYFIMPHEKQLWWVRIPLIFIFAGGLGNLIDRVRLGFVVDMLEFLFISFAIFNLADVFVVIGTFLLFFVILIMGKKAPWPFGEQKNV